ncbi:ABC transporter substrate-binding protein [Halobellus sp. EA9]|uniref:ABC transporter substrate-binding protein n=1 Tax=Halobellus sp. EA9 TaxID=3421647 RepID=UPI003EB6EC13
MTVSYWSGKAAENSSLQQYFKEGMQTFEDQHSNINVDLNILAWGQLTQKYITTMQSGTSPPALASAGTYGLEMFRNGAVEDLSTYMEGDPDLPEKWTPTMQESTDYRGQRWAGGIGAINTTHLGLNVSLFKEHTDVQAPEEDLNTWTQLRRALDQIQEGTGDGVYPYEVTGTQADVEAYWGAARTAYTGGTDPWIDVTDQGSPENPVVKPGQTERTDGMIKNNIDLGEQYSSGGYPSRGDEGVLPMLVNDKVAAYNYGVSVQGIRGLTPNATFGWDGDYMAISTPKLDPNYGEEFNLPELAGKEGQHGGHTWSLEGQLCVSKSKSSAVKEATYQLLKFRNTSPEFCLELYASPDLAQAVPAYTPLLDDIRSEEYADMRTQVHNHMIEELANYGENFRTTGAAWDTPGTNTIRWDQIGGTMAEAYAGQISRENAASTMGDRIRSTLAEQ